MKAASQRIRAEFPGIDQEKPLSFKLDGPTGVQDPYSMTNGSAALAQHGVYRCSVSIWAINILASPTPDIPMSMTRVKDMAEFFYSAGPKFLTDKQVEVCAPTANLPESPSLLQMVSPEEIVHAMILGCAAAIGLLGILLANFGSY